MRIVHRCAAAIAAQAAQPAIAIVIDHVKGQRGVGLDEDEVADGSTWCSMPLPAAMLAASMAL
jgi:hypothetical protein